LVSGVSVQKKLRFLATQDIPAASNNRTRVSGNSHNNSF
jgi:hypothetical protein